MLIDVGACIRSSAVVRGGGSGVNLLEIGILGDEEADSKGLVGRRGRTWDRSSSFPEKNEFFSLEMACFGVF